jgi:hypothetical protein
VVAARLNFQLFFKIFTLTSFILIALAVIMGSYLSVNSSKSVSKAKSSSNNNNNAQNTHSSINLTSSNANSQVDKKKSNLEEVDNIRPEAKSDNNKKKRATNTQDQDTVMSVILKPTVKHTASVIQLTHVNNN